MSLSIRSLTLKRTESVWQAWRTSSYLTRFMMNESNDQYNRDKPHASIGAPSGENEKIRGTPVSPSSGVVDLTGDSDDGSPQAPPPSWSAIQDPHLYSFVESCVKEQSAMLPNSPNHHGKSKDLNQKKLDDSFVNTDKTTSNASTVTKEPQQPSTGIDFKKLREERESRNKKRKIEDTVQFDSSRQTKILKPENSRRSSVEDVKRYGEMPKPQVIINQGRNERVTPLQFPQGAVKKTWVLGTPRENDIKIEEVMQKHDLELAILSSFQWNPDWLFTKFITDKTRFLLVMEAKDDYMKREIQKGVDSIPNVRVCFPPMEPQVNCMHSKLMLLFHSNYLRVVVPSANLVPYDWGEEGGIMENTVFLIDLPRISTGINNHTPTNFVKELGYFLKASTVHENIVARLTEFDFSATRDIEFVHTIGGSHLGEAQKHTGICGLGKAIGSLGLRTALPIKLDYVAASIGSPEVTFLRSMYFAAQGDEGLKELVLRSSKKFPSEKWGVQVQKDEGAEWKDRFRVYFPSQRTVRHSKGGPASAGTICFQPKWYNSDAQRIMRDNVSRRKGVLTHNKMLFVRPDRPIKSPDDTECPGWAYVGSANLSASAWGRLVNDRATSQPKLNCRNWESGVIIPIRRSTKRSTAATASLTNDNNNKNTDASDKGTATDVIALDEEDENAMIASTHSEDEGLYSIFDEKIPVPMQLPAPEFTDDNKPWFFMEDR